MWGERDVDVQREEVRAPLRRRSGRGGIVESVILCWYGFVLHVHEHFHVLQE